MKNNIFKSTEKEKQNIASKYFRNKQNKMTYPKSKKENIL